MLVDEWVVRLPEQGSKAAEFEPLLLREWLVTNALGGYASGTIAGVASRRYHGLLVAALPAPLGRQMMFNHLSDLVRLTDGTTAFLGGEGQSGGQLRILAAEHLTEFQLHMG